MVLIILVLSFQSITAQHKIDKLYICKASACKKIKTKNIDSLQLKNGQIITNFNLDSNSIITKSEAISLSEIAIIYTHKYNANNVAKLIALGYGLGGVVLGTGVIVSTFIETDSPGQGAYIGVAGIAGGIALIKAGAKKQKKYLFREYVLDSSRILLSKPKK